MQRQKLLSLTAKIQFQQAVNPVNAFMVPDIALPAQQLEQLLKTVARIFNCEQAVELYDINTPFKILLADSSALQYWKDIFFPGLTAVPLKPIPFNLYICHLITPYQGCFSSVTLGS